MKADFAWVWGADAAPGAKLTSTAISDLPGMLGMAASKFFVTVIASPSWADTAGHREGERRAGRVDDDSDLHGLHVDVIERIDGRRFWGRSSRVKSHGRRWITAPS
jgi:hypothetical protein